MHITDSEDNEFRKIGGHPFIGGVGALFIALQKMSSTDGNILNSDMVSFSSFAHLICHAVSPVDARGASRLRSVA